MADKKSKTGSKEQKNNAKIFNAIYSKLHIFTLKELDELFDLPLGSMQRITKNMRPLTMAQIIVLDQLYSIPSEVFNNTDLSEKDALEMVRSEIKRRSSCATTIFENNFAVIKTLSDFKALSLRDENNEQVTYNVDIVDNKITLKNSDNSMPGVIIVGDNDVSIFVKDTVRGQSIILIIYRFQINGDILPLTTIYDKENSYEKKIGNGFLLKNPGLLEELKG